MADSVPPPNPAGPFELPTAFFAETGARKLRIDATLRSIVGGAKAHGRRPWQYDHAMHGMLGCNFVVRGRGTYTEASGRTHELFPGVLFHRFPSIVHSTWFDPASDYAEFFVVFDATTGNQLLTTGLISSTPVVNVGADAVVLEEFRHLVKRMRLPETQLPSPRLLIDSITYLNELYDRARRNRVLDVWDRLIEDACLLLEHNLDERLPTQWVAEQLGVSYPAFRKHFKEATGHSPADYRIRRRLEAAQHHLMGSAVGATAQEFGYSDAYAFSAQFKTFIGLSPREFKRKMKHKLEFIPLARTWHPGG